MTAAAEPFEDIADDRLARRNALVLSAAQALGLSNNIVLIATASIVGAQLAPTPALATLPVSVYVVGLWQGTLPIGALAQRYGRRAAFEVGALCGVLTGLFCCLGVLYGSFLLFCIGTLFTGLYAAAHQSYRFAAADTASEAFRPKAISWVMAGGVVSAFIGPQLVILTQNLWQPYLFAATYIGQALLGVLAAGVLMLVRIPHRPVQAGGERRGRPLREIVRQPRFIVAVVCGVASYSLMNLVMTAAPLAMLMCQHPSSDAVLGIQWHVLGMFVPSFFTGSLIARFGVERIVGAGLAVLAASALISAAGITLWHFWIGLTVLGVGWNFGFIGATTMVAQCYRSEERTTVQAFNDFLVFGGMAAASFASGALLSTLGWTAVNVLALPVIVVSAALLGWLVVREPRAVATM